MSESTESHSNFSPAPTVRFNASGGQNNTDGNREQVYAREQRYDRGLKRLKELHLQKRREEREQDEQSNSEFLEALDGTECMIDVQEVLLRKLAAAESQLKNFSEPAKSGMQTFEECLKE